MKIQIDIPDRAVAALLCSAWEGGSTYWARSDGQPYDLVNGEMTLTLQPGERIPVYDLEDDNRVLYLTRAKIRKGLALMPIKAAYQFGQFLAGERRCRYRGLPAATGVVWGHHLRLTRPAPYSSSVIEGFSGGPCED